MHDDRQAGCGVGNCAHAILNKNVVQHLSHVVASVCKGGVVVFELNVKTNLGLVVVDSRSIGIEQANVGNDFLQGDHFEFVVEQR